MKQILLVILFMGLSASVVFAHLCNDVYLQAKDNLAVKVDIRDNQLRINESAEFRVYLLNTMDRTIDNIQLEVESDFFQAKVKPARDWRTFPRLVPVKLGGGKQFFDVLLQRKPGTAQGKYKIGLRLFNGMDRSMVFKTMDMDEAMETMTVPQKSMSLQIDGHVLRDEWEGSLLCTSFYEYRSQRVTAQNIYFHNVKCDTDVQTRVRFSHDEQNLYCMADFNQTGLYDIVYILITQHYQQEPVIVAIDLQEKDVQLLRIKDVDFNDQFAEKKPGIPLDGKFGDNKIEIKLPFDSVHLYDPKSFYLNIMRVKDDTMTFWRGNNQSVKDPMVYVNFIIE